MGVNIMECKDCEKLQTQLEMARKISRERHGDIVELTGKVDRLISVLAGMEFQNIHDIITKFTIEQCKQLGKVAAQRTKDLIQ